MQNRSFVGLALIVFMSTQPCVSRENIKTLKDQYQQKHPFHHKRDSSPFENVEEFAAKFDDPSRDAWQKPEEIFKFIGLKNSNKLAEIGAGTGYFSFRAAWHLKYGMVYAVDSEPKMLEFIDRKVKTLGINNLKTCKSSHNSIVLPEKVDAILMVNTFHHIDDRKRYISLLKSQLVPNGKLVIVEGKPQTPMEPPRELRVNDKQIIAELKSAGFSLIGDSSVLPYQYLQMFQPD